MKRPLRSMLVLAAATALMATGCAARPTTPKEVPVPSASSSTPAGVNASAAVTTKLAASGSTSASAGANKPPVVSATSLAYAKKIGGFDHKGLTLYFIIGGTFGTESDAQAALDRALPLFGDMQPYFIVQSSDSFAGMTPGRWVVVEAHFKTPSKENLEFARRGFPDAQVQRARVMVSAPIPVYEDIVGGD